MEYTYFENSVTFDPSVSSVYVAIRYDEAINTDKAVISFTIQNAEGQTTGAGTVCVGRRQLLSTEELKTYYILTDRMTVTRATVLGSVRFTDPASVTEEQVNALLEKQKAEAEEAFAAMDYSPVTEYEKRVSTYAEIVSTVLAEDGDITGSHGGIDGGADYSFFGTHHADNKDREFILLGDGTWVEINPYDSDEGCILNRCHADPNCPMTAEKGLHHPLWPGCHVTAKDGRVFELVSGEWENGFQVTLDTIKLIYDPAA